MTCYFRHLKYLFDKIGLEITKGNRKNVDQIIHKIVGIEYKNCSATWQAVKDRLAADETVFITILKQALSQ